jgi:hypothetical protein
MNDVERQRKYGDDVPWSQGPEAVSRFLEEKALELGITVDDAHRIAQYSRGGSRDSNDFTFDQAHMGLEMGLI